MRRPLLEAFLSTATVTNSASLVLLLLSASSSPSANPKSLLPLLKVTHASSSCGCLSSMSASAGSSAECRPALVLGRGEERTSKLSHSAVSLFSLEVIVPTRPRNEPKLDGSCGLRAALDCCSRCLLCVRGDVSPIEDGAGTTCSLCLSSLPMSGSTPTFVSEICLRGEGKCARGDGALCLCSCCSCAMALRCRAHVQRGGCHACVLVREGLGAGDGATPNHITPPLSSDVSTSNHQVY